MFKSFKFKTMEDWRKLKFVDRTKLSPSEYFEICMKAVKQNGLALQLVHPDTREGPILGYFLCQEALKTCKAHPSTEADVLKLIPEAFKLY